MSLTDDVLDDVQARVAAAGAATEAYLTTALYRDFGMRGDRARTALRLLAESGRIERRVAANGHVTLWASRRPTARASA
jgi:hypothetical protein